MITVVIPACNEEKNVGGVVRGARQHAAEVIVVDDGSVDATARVAQEAGAIVIRHEKRRGYIETTKTGIREAKGDVIVTIDGDGEHDPEDIPRLVKPVYDDKADLVLGTRGKIIRLSEKFINWLTKFKVEIADSCTGFRAIKKSLALRLSLKGRCTCGTLVLEANYYGARVIGVPIRDTLANEPKKLAWFHVKQVFYVLGWLLK